MRDLSDWIGLALLIPILLSGVVLFPGAISFVGPGSCGFTVLRSLAGLPIREIAVAVLLFGLYWIYTKTSSKGGF